MNRRQSKAVEPAAAPVPEPGAAGAPDLAELFELGLEHLKARRWPEAETALRQVLAGLKASPGKDGSPGRPSRLKVLNALGRVLNRQGRYAEAIDCYEHALVIDSGNALVFNNLGNSLRKANESDAAITCLERAVALSPKEPRFRFNLGHALSDRGRLGEALVQYDKARELDPGYTEASLNRAFTLLRLGDYANGFPACETRWSMPGRGPKKPDVPEWAGESYRGRRLLVYAEQGQGD
ncbi:MAG: tetratricopeptide repeat protein, partial [Alphaproteobacteria bacterium]